MGISDADKKDDGLTALVEFDVLCKRGVLPFSRRMQKRAQAGTGLFYGGFTHVSSHQPWESIGTYHKISPVSTNAHLMVCTVHEVITFMVWY